MAHQNAPDEYDDSEYDEYDYDEGDAEDDVIVVDYAGYAGARRKRAGQRAVKRGEAIPQGNIAARRAIDWSTTGGIITVILLTLLYAFSPIDAIPDVIPVAGQVDDVVAVTAGTATAGFLAFLRIALRAMIASRIGRKGCVILGAVMGVATVLAFIGLAAIISAIF